MLILPLDSIALTKSILGQCTSAMGVMQGVGVGIASIFLLFVIFHSVSSLLDGGKFQIKMLWPLVVYLIVCNFSLFASPVISFTSSIQSASLSAGSDYRNRIIANMTNNKVTDGDCSLFEAFMIKCEQEIEESQLDKELENELNELDDIEIEEVEAATDGKSSKKWNLKSLVSGTVNGIKSVLEWFGKWIGKTFTKLIAEPLLGAEPYKKMKWGLFGLIALIFSWVCEFLGLAVTCLGAVMTGIIVAFGPITFAFAVFPGNQKVIGSWLIRLCQFSLYSPIVALINAFITTTLFKMASASGGDSMVMLMGVLLCDIVALTSVPSIASMIIEGASGAVSLSQGLQTAGAAVGAASSALTAAPRAGYNLAREVQSWKDRSANIGEVSRDNKMQHALDAIAKAADPNYSPLDGGGGGTPTGQNPNMQ